MTDFHGLPCAVCGEQPAAPRESVVDGVIANLCARHDELFTAHYRACCGLGMGNFVQAAKQAHEQALARKGAA